MIRSKATSNLLELQKWCMEYEVLGQLPQPPSIRFGIGIYQIYQGVKWEGSDSGYESFASAVMHFVYSGELVKAPIEQFLSIDFTTIRRQPIDFKNLLISISMAQQMFIYNLHPVTTRRKSRFKPEVLAKNLADACKILLGTIPSNKRKSSLGTAMATMCGGL